VDIAVVTELVAADFVNTLRISSTLNLRVIAKNIVVFVTMGTYNKR
jgi:hypothetical protein